MSLRPERDERINPRGAQRQHDAGQASDQSQNSQD